MESTLGAIAGAVGSASAVLGGAETSAILRIVAGSVGSALGGLMWALLDALLGCKGGCVPSAAAAKAIDSNILNNHKCQERGHAFSKS